MIRYGLTATIDLEDRIWYAAVPAIAYATLAAASIPLFSRNPMGLTVLAGGMGLLLLAGIRNAWDITSWAITRHRE
jgi:biotin transporter BioY